MKEGAEKGSGGPMALLSGIADSVREIVGGLGKNLPFLAPVGMGIGALVLLVLAVILLGLIPWGAMNDATPPAAEVPGGNPAVDAGFDPAFREGPLNAPVGQVPRPDAERAGGPVKLDDIRDRVLPGSQDPFLSRPILPDELAFFRYGELEFHRLPRQQWTIEDIAPFWIPLREAVLKDLREANHREFMQILGLDPEHP